MRLALVSWEALHALPIGGVAVHVSAMAEALARRGHDVHLFTRRGPGQRLDDRIGGVAVHRCPFTPHPAFIDEAIAFAEPVRHYLLAEEARGGSFDRIYAHDWPAFPAALACVPPPSASTGFSARRLAVAFHSTEWGRTGQWPEAGLSARIAEFEREACRRADAVVNISKLVRRQVEALYQPPDWKMETVHQGVDVAPFDDVSPAEARAARASLGVSPAAPTALFVGRLDERRGADRLPAIWKRVSARHPRACLVVVGEGPLADDLARALPGRIPGTGEATGGVVYAGWRDGPSLAALYRGCTVLVAPDRRDPYGQTTLSAWAAGRPAAALRAAAAGEFVLPGVNGWLAHDVDELDAALDEAFTDAARADWLGANGRTAVETAFTWDRVAEKTEGVFGRRARLTSDS